MMLPIYVVSSSDFVEVPNKNTFAIFFLTTDSLFYAKINNNDIISVVSLGGASLTGFLFNNIDVTALQNHTNNATDLAAIQILGDNVIQTMNYPNLVTLLTLSLIEANALTSILVPLLETVDNIIIEETQSIVDLDFPSLITIDGNVNIQRNVSLQTLDFIALVTCTAVLSVEENPLLTSFRIPSLVNANSTPQGGFTLHIKDNVNLTSITIGDGILLSTAIDFSGNALTQANVDQILSRVRNSGQINGTLVLSGGTNASPTGGVANADRVALIADGWVVNIN